MVFGGYLYIFYSHFFGQELATRYPTVKDFWFDGTWDASIKQNGWWTAHVERMLKYVPIPQSDFSHSSVTSLCGIPIGFRE